MSQPVHLTTEASSELEDAARWYEERHAGLGLRFLAAVDLAIESIARWPGLGTPVAGVSVDLPIRRVPIGRYPYYVAYIDGEEVLTVLAIAHVRRRPKYWGDRAPA